MPDNPTLAEAFSIGIRSIRGITWAYFLAGVVGFCVAHSLIARLTAKGIRVIYIIGSLVFALSVSCFILSFPFGWITKCVALLAWLACVTVFLKFGVKSAEFEKFSRHHLWAAAIAMIVSASCYLGLFNGNTYLYDWAKHRAVLLSIYQQPLAPTIQSFNLSYSTVAGDAPLIYYYAPYMLPALLVRASTIGHDRGVDVTIRRLQIAYVLFNLALLYWCYLFAPSFFSRFRRLEPMFVFLLFLLWLFWSGGDFWVSKFLGLPKDVWATHRDTFSDPSFVAAVHGMVSLWTWVPSQLVSTLGVFGLAGPFWKKPFEAPLAIGGVLLLCGNPFGLPGIALPMLVWLFWKDNSGWRKQIQAIKQWQWISLLSGSLALFFVVGFLSARLAPDTFHLHPQIAGAFKHYLLFLARDFVFPMSLLALLLLHRRIRPLQFCLISLALLWPTLFYMGLFNAWILKVSIPATIWICGVLAALTQDEPRWLQRLMLTAGAAFMFPLFINEWLHYLTASSALFEQDAEIIKQYVGNPEAIWFLFRF